MISLSSCSVLSCLRDSCSISEFWCLMLSLCAYLSCRMTCFSSMTSFLDVSWYGLELYESRIGFISLIWIVLRVPRTVGAGLVRSKRLCIIIYQAVFEFRDNSHWLVPFLAYRALGKMPGWNRECQCDYWGPWEGLFLRTISEDILQLYDRC